MDSDDGKFISESLQHTLIDPVVEFIIYLSFFTHVRQELVHELTTSVTNRFVAGIVVLKQKKREVASSFKLTTKLAYNVICDVTSPDTLISIGQNANKTLKKLKGL